MIKHLAKVKGDLPANEVPSSLNRKYVLREEWVEECIAKKKLIDEREEFGGWEVKYVRYPFFFSWESGMGTDV